MDKLVSALKESMKKEERENIPSSDEGIQEDVAIQSNVKDSFKEDIVVQLETKDALSPNTSLKCVSDVAQTCSPRTRLSFSKSTSPNVQPEETEIRSPSTRLSSRKSSDEAVPAVVVVAPSPTNRNLTSRKSDTKDASVSAGGFSSLDAVKDITVATASRVGILFSLLLHSTN